MTSRIKIVLSMVVILIAIAATVGGTLAWFTAEAEVVNEFTAGTVMIDADETAVRKYGEEVELDNVNPGDCYEKEFYIENTGTKYVLLRMMFNDEWEYDSAWEEWISNNWSELKPGFNVAFDNYNWQAFTVHSNAPLNTEQWDEFKSYVATLETAVMDDAFTIYLEIDPDEHEWYEENGWFYMHEENGPLAPGASISAYVKVCFDGNAMTNEFQKAKYKLTAVIEAIQASNNASGSAWGVDSWYFEMDEAGELVVVDGNYVPRAPETSGLNLSGSNWADWEFNQ